MYQNLNKNIIKNEYSPLKKKYMIQNRRVKQILQCNIKKGQKFTTEIMFKKMVFYMAQNKKHFLINSWFLVNKGIINIIPGMDIKIIKVRRRVFYSLKVLTPKKQNLYVYQWLTKKIKRNNNYINFYKSFAQELKDAFFKKGEAINQCNSLYKTIEENIRLYNFD